MFIVFDTIRSMEEHIINGNYYLGIRTVRLPSTSQGMPTKATLSHIHHDQCLVYLDDIFVFSSCLGHHIARLEYVHKYLSDSSVKLKHGKRI